MTSIKDLFGDSTKDKAVQRDIEYSLERVQRVMAGSVGFQIDPRQMQTEYLITRISEGLAAEKEDQVRTGLERLSMRYGLWRKGGIPLGLPGAMSERGISPELVSDVAALVKVMKTAPNQQRQLNELRVKLSSIVEYPMDTRNDILNEYPHRAKEAIKGWFGRDHE